MASNKKTAGQALDPMLFTLAQFEAVAPKDVRKGQVLIFRSFSLSHNEKLSVRHGRTCRVTDVQQGRVVVRFRDPEAQDGLSEAFRLDPKNLIAVTDGTMAVAKLTFAYVNETLVADAANLDEAHFRVRAFLSRLLPREMLLRAQAMVAPAPGMREDLPF